MNNQKKEIIREVLSSSPVSVSDYISIVNELLSRVDLKVIGEVGDMKVASSGHVYFSLKDEKTKDIINCVIWGSIYRMCGFKIENGMNVIISGSADVYRARGTLTFKVKTVEPVGEGALKKAYDELKERLEKEGLFSDERKRDIPKFPHRIGVITSMKGAAIHDFVNNIGKFGFNVLLCDSRVEGQEAVEDILMSIKIMKKKDLDVLVIIRGGGSIQSLMAFDNEMIVKEIIDFPVPVITGIGHHEDITLAALAADLSESTPTGVANRLSRDYRRAEDFLSLCEKKIENLFKEALYKNKEKVSFYSEKLTFYFKKIFDEYKYSEKKIKEIMLKSTYFLLAKKEKVDNIRENILFVFKSGLKDKRREIERYEEIILNSNPEKQLRLGYAIVKKGEKVIKSVKNIKKEDLIQTTFFDGQVLSNIKKIKNDKKK